MEFTNYGDPMENNQRGGIEFTGEELLAVTFIASEASKVARVGGELSARSKALAARAAEAYYRRAKDLSSPNTISVETYDLAWFVQAARQFGETPKNVKKLARLGLLETVQAVQEIDTQST